MDVLCTEYQINPIGIDIERPRLSWQSRSRTRGSVQVGYQTQVALTENALRDGDLFWDSGRVTSDQSTQVPYSGPALESAQRYFWRVRTWNETGGDAVWSPTAYWEMGLLRLSDWSAQWITPANEVDANKPNPAPLLRKTFALSGAVREARLYITSLGLYEAELNGRRVGDQVLTPGWTSYDKRLQYQTYDVTPLLQAGRNAIGVTLGSGWYSGPLVWTLNRNHYGDRLALLAQLRVTYADGRIETVDSDASWRTSTGPIVLSEIYAGERYDARLAKTGWSLADYDDRAWSGVCELDHSKQILLAPVGPPVRKIEEIKPIAISRAPSGATIVDLGQNMVGYVRLKVRGPAGATVTLRHGEVLDPAGNLYLANLRGAEQKVDYILKGGDEEMFEPHFTFQGFRYVSVQGYPGELTRDSITGVVVHSDFARTGQWESSNPLLNQLQHNIVWGLKGNFVDVPTDCPQRDERLGWTADAQVFARTAAFNADVAGFFSKWLKDLAVDQYSDGSVPWVIPDVIRVFDPGVFEGLPEAIRQRGPQPAGGAAGWSDAATVIPWTVYQAYGDRLILADQYESMCRWVDYVHQRAGADLIWAGDFQYGDWLDFDSASRDRFGATNADLIATAYFAHSTNLLSRTASVLGKGDDAARYAKLLADIRTAFQSAFVAPDAKVGAGTQTGYVLALQFDLLPEEQRAAAAKHLAEAVRGQGHLTTGFLGTPWLLFALSKYGYLAEAYGLLTREDYPSWLYPVKRGATTIWERWDGIKPDGSFQSTEMNSFNHYAYGAVGEWMYQVIAGINTDPAAPGYKRSIIQPQPGGDLTWVKASHETPYGRIASAWEIKEGLFHLDVTVPPNTRAVVHLPKANVDLVLEGGRKLVDRNGVAAYRQAGKATIVDVGSGDFHFSYAWSAP